MTPLLQIQHERRAQNNPFMRIPLVQRLQLLRLVVHNDARDAAKLPRSVDTIGCATGLVAKAHVIRVLIVEGDPLGFACAFDVGEGDLAVVAVDAGYDDAVAAKSGFLVVRFAGGGGVFTIVSCAVDSSDFSRLDIEIPNVVPLEFDGLFLFVDFKWQPDVSAFPETVGVPLVTHVDVSSLLGTVDPEVQARLRVEGAGVQWCDDEGLRPGASKRVGTERNNV